MNRKAIWDEFCERLKEAGRVLDRECTPQDELTIAEGYRKLLRLVRVGFEAASEFGNPDDPQVYQAVTSTGMGEGETSDARYHQAFINGTETYYVRGLRGDAPLIEFTVYSGKIGFERCSHQIDSLTERDLVVHSDGTYEIALSQNRHTGNWLRTGRGATLLYIRQYAHDWSGIRGATFAIQKEGGREDRSPLTIAQIVDGLMRTATFVDNAAHYWAAIVDRLRSAPSNTFFEIPTDSDSRGSTMPAGHRFSSGYFRLLPEEALEVTFLAPAAPYWGLDLTNYWFEPLSYEDHRSHVNNQTARYETDGSVRLTIASQYRRRSNWLDTRGHLEGCMIFRWSRSSDPAPIISTRVIPLPQEHGFVESNVCTGEGQYDAAAAQPQQ